MPNEATSAAQRASLSTAHISADKRIAIDYLLHQQQPLRATAAASNGIMQHRNGSCSKSYYTATTANVPAWRTQHITTLLCWLAQSCVGDLAPQTRKHSSSHRRRTARAQAGWLHTLPCRHHRPQPCMHLPGCSCRGRCSPEQRASQFRSRSFHHKNLLV